MPQEHNLLHTARRQVLFDALRPKLCRETQIHLERRHPRKLSTQEPDLIQLTTPSSEISTRVAFLRSLGPYETPTVRHRVDPIPVPLGRYPDEIFNRPRANMNSTRLTPVNSAARQEINRRVRTA